MAKHSTKRGSRSKEIRAWGIRRHKVDINQLALAYYLLARIRIEEQQNVDSQTGAGDAAQQVAEPTSDNCLANQAEDESEAA